MGLAFRAAKRARIASNPRLASRGVDWLALPILSYDARLAMIADAKEGRMIGQGFEKNEPANAILDIEWRTRPDGACARREAKLQAAPCRQAHGFRRGGRVVDRAALEMRSTRKGTGGSNPSLSATNHVTY